MKVAQAIAKAMKAEGVDILFAYPVNPLIEALRNGVIAGAGLDVLEQEPPAPDNPLLTMENVVVTPHVASATTRMRPETRRRAAREVALVLRGRWPMSCVNPTVLPRVQLERWQPYPMSRGPNR